MKHQNKNSKKPNVGSMNTNNDLGYSNRDYALAFLDTAMMIGFSRKEALKIMHTQGIYLTK